MSAVHPEAARADDDAALELALDRDLETPRTEAEVRNKLALGQGEVRALLRSGFESGRFARTGKPFRYVLKDVSSQTTLFDAA